MKFIILKLIIIFYQWNRPGPVGQFLRNDYKLLLFYWYFKQ